MAGAVVASRLAGILPICTTPFTAAGEVDFASLKRVAQHILAGGADGLVYPGIASEFQTLSETERRRGIETVIAVVRRRLPVVVGISAPEPETSVRYAGEARAAGADAVMLMPPPELSDLEALTRLFDSVADAGRLPIVLQNAPLPLGPALPIATVAALAERCALVRYAKEETPPCGQRISALLAAASATLLGVFGGAGGRFIIDELARGAVGSMPACEYTGLHVEIFRAFARGEQQAARVRFNRLLPLLNFGSIYRTAATKEILFRMGIIESSRHRDASPVLDAHDHQELTEVIDNLAVAAPSAGVRRAS